MSKKFLSLILLIMIGPGFVQSQTFTPEVQKFILHEESLMAITDVLVIDGTGDAPKKNLTVILDDGKIKTIGKSSEVVIPDGVIVIYGKGKTLIPGLVMMHEHLFYTKLFENFFDVTQMSYTFSRLYLAGGVTTMRTAGSIEPQTDLNVKKFIKEGRLTGPKMDVTGPFIERNSRIGTLGSISDTEEIGKMIDYWSGKGVTSFKLYNNITREDMAKTVAEAHKRGLKVTGHLCSVTYAEASNLGLDNLEHGFMAASDFYPDKKPDLCNPFAASTGRYSEPLDGERIDRLINLLIKNGTAITSTPNVFEPYTGREIVPGGGMVALTSQLKEREINIYNSRLGRDSLSAAMFHKNLQWLNRFYEAGGHLMAGTDPTGSGRTVAGYANQRTIEIFVEAGFSIADAIKICTLNGAIYLDQDDQIGSIEAGKTADLVLIDGDLTSSVSNIRKMEIVFKNGIGYDSQAMFDSVKGKVGAE
jgi:imidazolonepropionase-like amidohydrolase